MSICCYNLKLATVRGEEERSLVLQYVVDSCLLTPSPSLQWDGEEKWTKGETCGLR